MIQRKILVTYALPYANGPIHLGHLVGYLQADIWVRFQKMQGHQAFYICASDEHGTPIMVKAMQQNIAPEQLTQQIRAEQIEDFNAFAIDFDNFHTTHSTENKQLASMIYQRLKERGDIKQKIIEQAYDPEKNMFLPDRYVKGICPRCKASDQYGDNCENCSATYTPLDLIEPKSILSGVAPIKKSSEHYFFQLQHYTELLQQWTQEEHLQPQVLRKLNEWFASGLKEWDISRDSPYFGFEIPDAPGKYFYVWLDAPIGYMASFKNYCLQHPEIDFADYWSVNSNTELYHFIGKDIMYFHALFWPAMLMGANLRQPTAVYAHGFLTINGKKMSKSRGTFIKARTYLDCLDPQFLRYYYAAKLNSHIEDLDLQLDDFIQRNNSDLIGKVVNIASRCSKFINKYFNNKLAAQDPEAEQTQQFIDAGDKIAKLYEQREFNRAVRLIMQLADCANQYIDSKKPWALVKQENKLMEVQEICSHGINLFKILIVYLKPILPQLAAQVESFLQISSMSWESRKDILLQHDILPFKPLLQRIDKNAVEQMLEQASYS